MLTDEMRLKAALFEAFHLMAKAGRAVVMADWRTVGRATFEAGGVLETANRLAVSLVAAEQERRG